MHLLRQPISSLCVWLTSWSLNDSIRWWWVVGYTRRPLYLVTRWIGVLVGPKASLDAVVEKRYFFPLPKIDSIFHAWFFQAVRPLICPSYIFVTVSSFEKYWSARERNQCPWHLWCPPSAPACGSAAAEHMFHKKFSATLAGRVIV